MADKKENPIIRHSFKILLVFAVLMSVTSFIWAYKNNYIVTYNDSMAHLNIARFVIDNIQPGFAQIGSVWLPLNHILSLSLVWNNWAWHSGFAGSFFSMISYVISVLLIYKIVQSVTENKIAATIGGLAFALNLNILYLQSTPLTEPLFILFFILSAYFFTKYLITNNPNWLFLLGIAGFMEVLTRYDGWFITGIGTILIFYFELMVYKHKFKVVLGKILVFLTPIVFGMTLWFIWNFLIFGNPLYFVFGYGSAKSQQNAIASNVDLITKGSIHTSFLAYWYLMLANIGLYTIIAALVGIIIFIFWKKTKINTTKKIFITFFLLSPILFNILALYLGFSIINTPQLGWNPTGKLSDQWFNTRYGILALPFISVYIGLFSNFKKICALIAILLILFQGIVLSNSIGMITLTDGVAGSSSFNKQDTANELRDSVKSNEKVLISASLFSAIMFRSGINLKQFIHEGDHKEWLGSLVEPEKYTDWVVVANDSQQSMDPIYLSLIKKQSNNFLYFYKLEYKGKHADIYKLKDNNELLAKRTDNHLMIGDENFIIKGANSYDLAYQTREEITESFRWLNSVGANTVRFWLFGDGLNDGFQPQAGVINEDRFKNVDLIISLAQKYNIKLIPVLVNNWPDYGGKKQYLAWTGNDVTNEDLFFTDEKVVALYKNYINHVITRTNTITNKSYKEEPSILAWEMINEPRTTSDNNKILYNWSSNIAQFIKQIDGNHLILVGTEKVDLQSNGYWNWFVKPDDPFGFSPEGDITNLLLNFEPSFS